MSNLTGTLKNKNGDTLFPEGMQVVTNSNGTALKFANGVLICFGRKAYPVNFATGNEIVNIKTTFTFPVQFYDIPVALVSNADDSTNNTYCSIYDVVRNSTGISQVSVWRLTAHSGTVNLHYMALGRWK